MSREGVYKEAVWELESIYIHSYNTTQQETVNAVYAMMSHTMKALKCKTLGGIHMQSTAAMELCTYIIYTSVVYILRMRVRVPRPSPVSRLFHAGCTSS